MIEPHLNHSNREVYDQSENDRSAGLNFVPISTHRLGRCMVRLGGLGLVGDANSYSSGNNEILFGHIALDIGLSFFDDMVRRLCAFLRLTILSALTA